VNHTLIAILRGVRPEEVLDIAEVLVEAGWRAIEVPLNSPDPLRSIERLATALDPSILVGAGTVLSPADVDAVHAAGAQLVLSPNRDLSVIGRTREHGLLSMPGVATPTEAFEALAAGASAIKLFPADVLGPGSFNAWAAVLPAHTAMYAVGGVDASNLGTFRRAGARGAGLGSSLYSPGIGLKDLRQRAQALLLAWSEGA
jgi:2-dehydro-3-deoxyphosphogalactonate aldolase